MADTDETPETPPRRGKVRELHVVNKALRIVKLANINFDESYQRGVRPHYQTIVAAFDVDALGVPLLGQREDNTLWCVDGRQRITALLKLGYTEVRADVFKSDGPAHEAAVFKMINGNRRPPRPGEMFKAMLTAEDQIALLVKHVADEHGFKITTTGRSRSGDPVVRSDTLTCVNVCVRIAQQSGGDALGFALGVIRAAWPGDPERTRAEVVGGLWQLWLRCQERAVTVDQDKLARQLRAVTPAQLVGAAKGSSLGAAGGVAREVARRGKLLQKLDW